MDQADSATGFRGRTTRPAGRPATVGFVRYARVAAAIVPVFGGLALLGWATGVEVLRRVVPGVASMKANTALAFVFAGASLSLSLARPSDRRFKLAAQALSLAAGAIGVLTVLEYAFGWNLGIDQLLVVDTESRPPGRMNPATAVGFALIGPALFCLTLETRRWRVIAQAAAVLSGTISLLALMGYLYGVPSLYKFAPYVAMAPNTAALLFLISTAVLAAQPQVGFMTAVVADDAGGRLARRLLPVVIGFPTLIGGLALAAERARLVDSTLKTVFVVTANVVVLTTSVVWSVWWLHVAEERRSRAEEALHERDAAIRRAYVDVIDAVTGGKLLLMTPDEVEQALGEPVSSENRVVLGEITGAITWLEQALRREFPLLENARAFRDACGEALTNAVKHAEGGSYQLYRRERIAQLRVSDHGPGIDFTRLPKATLATGYSSVGTLGIGFSQMLKNTERVLLSTQPGSTTVVLEVRASGEAASGQSE